MPSFWKKKKKDPIPVGLKDGKFVGIWDGKELLGALEGIQVGFTEGASQYKTFKKHSFGFILVIFAPKIKRLWWQ